MSTGFTQVQILLPLCTRPHPLPDSTISNHQKSCVVQKFFREMKNDDLVIFFSREHISGGVIKLLCEEKENDKKYSW